VLLQLDLGLFVLLPELLFEVERKLHAARLDDCLDPLILRLPSQIGDRLVINLARLYLQLHQHLFILLKHFLEQ
jgi:hypothetical protein